MNIKAYAMSILSLFFIISNIMILDIINYKMCKTMSFFRLFTINSTLCNNMSFCESLLQNVFGSILVTIGYNISKDMILLYNLYTRNSLAACNTHSELNLIKLKV